MTKVTQPPPPGAGYVALFNAVPDEDVTALFAIFVGHGPGWMAARLADDSHWDQFRTPEALAERDAACGFGPGIREYIGDVPGGELAESKRARFAREVEAVSRLTAAGWTQEKAAVALDSNDGQARRVLATVTP